MSAVPADLLTRCWLCDGELPESYTTVVKNGVTHPVHWGCRPEAISVVVEDHEDTFVPPLPIG